MVLVGLKNKREVWRVQYTMAKIRAVARSLLTLPEKVTNKLVVVARIYDRKDAL